MVRFAWSHNNHRFEDSDKCCIRNGKLSRRPAVGCSVWLGLVGFISLWNIPLAGYLVPTGLLRSLLFWRGNGDLLKRQNRLSSKNAGREVSKYEPDLFRI